MSVDISRGLPPVMEKKNGEIEVLRIFCALSIVFNHMHFLFYGNRAVEIFFLLSGFLMMRSIAKRANGPCLNGTGLMQETSSFIWGKVKRLYPELAVSLFFAAIAYIALSREPLMVMFQDIVRVAVGDLFMLRTSGIIYYVEPMNGATWYIFSMLIGLTFLYPLVRRYGVTLFLFVICLCIMGYRLRTIGIMGRYYDVVGGTLWGNVRAFADMGLGACAYSLAKRLSELPLRRCCRFLCDAVKLVCACALACLILWRGTPHDGHGLFLFFAFVFIVLSFSGQGLCSNIFNNRVAYFLGSFSLPLYLSHRCYTLHMRLWFPGDAEYMAAVLISSVLTALCVMYGAKLWRKYITVDNVKTWLLRPAEKG